MHLGRTRLRLAAAVIVAVAAAAAGLSPLDTVDAAGDSSRGVVIDVSASVAGRYSPPSGYWEDPCEPPTEYRSNIADALPAGGGALATTRIRDGVLERAVATYCYHAEDEEFMLGTLRIWWIADPDPATLVPAVFDYLPDHLDPPTVEWPNMSPEHGWLFVKVPMDFRVSNLEPITLTATATNLLGTATASVTATPDRVVFASGDVGGAECSAEQALEPYVPREFGACSYRYESSSTVTGGPFGSRTTMYWAVTSDPVDPSQPTELDTWTEQALWVSEVQAVVACSGSNC